MANSADENSISDIQSIQKGFEYETSSVDSSFNNEHSEKLVSHTEPESHSPVEITSDDSYGSSMETNSTACQFQTDGVAGNGALMRLTPVPLFFYKHQIKAVLYSGISGQITHGDKKAYDACRYYGALIVAALHGETKEQLLDKEFYSKHKNWFQDDELHPDILDIAKGSYQKEGGYDEGIRGKGYIVNALEAALWAFWSDGDSFEKGACAAVNLGDDTDTTAAIYGQLAGAYYGFQNLPQKWTEKIYAKKFLETLSKWIAYQGEEWNSESKSNFKTIPILSKFMTTLPEIASRITEPETVPEELESSSAKVKTTLEETETTTEKRQPSIEPEVPTKELRSSEEELQLPLTQANATTEEPKLSFDEPIITFEKTEPLFDEPTIQTSEFKPTSQESQPIIEEPESPNDESKSSFTNFNLSATQSKPIYEEIYSSSEEPKLTSNDLEPTFEISKSSREEPDVSFKTLASAATGITSRLEDVVLPSQSSSSREFQTKLEEPKQAFEEIKTSPEPLRSLGESNIRVNDFKSTREEYNRRLNSPEIEENVIQYPITLPVQYTSLVKNESTYQSDNMRTVPVNYQPNIYHGNDYGYGRKQETRLTNETKFSSHSHENVFSINRSLYQGGNLAKWTNSDVCYWIESFGINYKSYVERFRKEKIDGFGLFSYVGLNTLIEFGIRNEEHQKKILDGIQALKARLLIKH
ncbi:hypothetical protein I4U23_004807 [Adineta vaga]|nr:hypothetical protein I4U23_004807 [Adineta vaga]